MIELGREVETMEDTQYDAEALYEAGRFADASAHAIAVLREAIDGLTSITRTLSDEWRKNSRNRYQPYMVYSRRPRYQPKYPA
jgi:hypothetical protein